MSVRKYAKVMFDGMMNGKLTVTGGIGFEIRNNPDEGIACAYHYGTKIAEFNYGIESVNVQFGGWSATDQRFINDMLFLFGWKNRMACKRHNETLSIIYF